MAFGEGFTNIAGGVGTLVGAGVSALTAGRQYRQQRELLQQQQQYQKELMRLQNDLSMQNREEAYRKYDSPVAQRAAMKVAGINPFVSASGGLQPVGVGAPDANAPSVPNLPDVPNSGLQIGSALQQGAQSLFQMQQQAKLTESQVQLQNAQRIKTLAETTGVENQNSLFDFVRSAAESDALSKRFRVLLDEVDARFAEARVISDLDERSARIASIWADYENKLASAAKSDAERLTIDTMRDIQRRQGEKNIELTAAQTDAVSASAKESLSSAALKDAQVVTENNLRPARLNQLLSEIDLNDEHKRTLLYNRLVDILGLTLPASAAAGAAQEVIKSRRLGNSLFGQLRELDVKRVYKLLRDLKESE